MAKGNLTKPVIICPVCRKEVEQKKKGRPTEYHPNCRTFEKLTNWLESMLPSMPTNRECVTHIRSKLWLIGNQVQTTPKRKSPANKKSKKLGPEDQ